jgi:leukotriene A-4 hydrolase/aminopeptidase
MKVNTSLAEEEIVHPSASFWMRICSTQRRTELLRVTMYKNDPHSCWQTDSPRIEHITLDLDADFERQILKGHAEYRFDRPLDDELKLDTRQLNIHSVSAIGAAECGVRYTLGEDAGFLGRVLTVSGVRGLSVLRIEYSTSPDASALQWLKPEQTAGKKYPFMFSQCQAIHARTVFPCQDTPAVRFTYEAALRVPESLTVVMAAESLGSQREHGKTICKFRTSLPIPSYLFALAAGNLVSEELGSRSRVYAEPETIQAAKWEYAEVDRMLDCAEGLFGAYLWNRFDLLHMPPSFPYGGMENPRLTFLTPTLIAGDRSLVSVVAHELAHSWTGNLVTNATWQDFWLNEGFTVYAERRIIEAMYGEEMANLHSVNGRTALNVSIADFGENSPFTKLKTDLNGVDPDAVFSSVPYEKGYLLLVAIERVVGRAEFDRFLKAYIHEFSFQSLTTEELMQYMKTQLKGIEKKIPLNDWIYKSGVPQDAPQFRSRLIDEVADVRAKWDNGARDLQTAIKNWSVQQKVLFLENLPRLLSTEDCSKLDSLFELSKTRNCEIKVPWLCIAAASSYQPAFSAISEFLGEVGRGKYLRPLFKALFRNPDTRQLAFDLFAKFGERYHSVGQAAVQRILAG